MRIVEAVLVAKGDQRDPGSVENLAGRNGPFERHDVGVVQDADADAVGLVPAADLCSLHVARHFAEDGEAIAGTAICYQQSRIFRTPGVKGLAWDSAILREEGGFVSRSKGDVDGLDVEV